MMAQDKGVSVIICCFNSANRLPETLQHLALQQVSVDIPWEVIVVNNNSTDNTTEIAIQEWNKYPLHTPIRVVDQPIIGLSHARKKGIETAKYDLCLFCDDDNWLCENYVKITYEIFSNNPLIGALGGRGTPVCEISPPTWFKNFEGGYAVGKQSMMSGSLTNSRGYVYGAGAAFRKTALTKLFQKGFRSLLTGRKGKSSSSGEDKELCYGLILIGYEIWYDERLKFNHFIPKERLTPQYIKSINSGFARASLIHVLYEYIIKEKKVKNLRLLWVKDFLYILYSSIKMRKMKNDFFYNFYRIVEMWRLRWTYTSLYKNIFTLKQR